MMHWGNFGGMGFGGFGLGWIFMVIFWALLIFGMIYIARQMRDGEKSTPIVETAEDILKKKYAAGEITRDEYRGKMEEIS